MENQYPHSVMCKKSCVNKLIEVFFVSAVPFDFAQGTANYTLRVAEPFDFAQSTANCMLRVADPFDFAQGTANYMLFVAEP